ncbi:MAG: GNAT family N-acetyltransferase [Candidatus Algichlamydia australiensis]|nr:GNAT family N-acetyltransferase [Chlamydiales bacterium]
MTYKKNIEIISLQGKEILPYLRELARLRMVVFKEWPYLYDGSYDGEEKYLQIYAETQNALFILAIEGGTVIGAVTGIPVSESMEEVQEVFLKKNLPMNKVYYLGEIMLLKEFRNKGTGKKMYLAFEKFLKELKKFEKVVLCEIFRDKSDKRMPTEYKSLTTFWESLGYKRLPNLEASFSYKEMGLSKESSHAMHFHEKNLALEEIG